MRKQVQIYGDSVMRGVILGEDNRYCFSRGGKIDAFMQEFPVDIQNKSSFGCTVTKGCQLLEKGLKKQEASPCDMILVEYGGNDCDFNWEEVAAAPEAEHLPKTPLSKFEGMMRGAVKAIKDKVITPLLMSLPPIDAERYIGWITKTGLSKQNIVKWLGDVHMIYRFQELYSNTIGKIARETGSFFVDVRSYFLDKHNYKHLFCADGIHPNVDGHELIRVAFGEFMRRNDGLLACGG